MKIKNLLPKIPDLYDEVYELLKQIPEGKVSTYKAIARALGDKSAARAVGKILSENENPDLYPCYKIVYSDGKVGNYRFGGTTEKTKRLAEDGIKIAGGKVIGCNNCLFEDFLSDAPLKKLLEYQKRFVAKTESVEFEIKTIGGVDVSYSSNSSDAVAVYTLFDFKTNKMTDYMSHSAKIRFPYIPGYLSFRELPILSELIGKVKSAGKMADVVLVDGNGLLHPRGAGIASMLGAICNIKTVGVAKSLLCGTLGDEGFVRMNGKIAGKKITKGFKPVFVSAGWKTDLSAAVNIVTSTMIHRLAEPLRMAHILSRNLCKRLKQ